MPDSWKLMEPLMAAMEKAEKECRSVENCQDCRVYGKRSTGKCAMALCALHLVESGIFVRETGTWAKHETLPGYVYCDNCKDVYLAEEWLADGKWNCCPNCGAYNRKGENDG